MQACLLTDVGRLELRKVYCPAPGPHDVLLEVAAVGVCGTDFHIFSGESNYNLDKRGQPIPLSKEPQILGHEIVGFVREVGSAVRDLAPGDPVVIDQGINCASAHRAPVCEFCRSGDSHQCEHYAEHGITGLPGGFAERICVPAVNCVRIHSDLPPVEAALTEPLACVLHAADRAARAKTRYALVSKVASRSVRTVILLGAGPAGLLFLQVLRNVLGFSGTILVSEIDHAKRALAASFGAVAIDPRADDLVEVVLERTKGRRAEYLIEATGSGQAFAQIPAVIRKQATVLLYGIGHSGASLELVNQLQWKEPTCVFSVGASGGFDADGRPAIYRRALQLIESGKVRVGSMISHRYAGLAKIPAAFAGDHRKEGYVKGVVVLAPHRGSR